MSFLVTPHSTATTTKLINRSHDLRMLINGRSPIPTVGYIGTRQMQLIVNFELIRSKLQYTLIILGMFGFCV